MEHLKHKDLKKLLCLAMGLGSSIAFLYIFSLEQYIFKIPRIDLEILQNFQITESLVRSNVTHTIVDKKIAEVVNVVKMESGDSIKNANTENGFHNDEKSTERSSASYQAVTNEIRKADPLTKEILPNCSLNDTDLGKCV